MGESVGGTASNTSIRIVVMVIVQVVTEVGEVLTAVLMLTETILVKYDAIRKEGDVEVNSPDHPSVRRMPSVWRTRVRDLDSMLSVWHQSECFHENAGSGLFVMKTELNGSM